MPDDTQPFTEKELEALAREHGKPVRDGFEKDVLAKIRSPKKDRVKELEDLVKEKDEKNPEMGLD